jgi:hypothetical protein
VSTDPPRRRGRPPGLAAKIGQAIGESPRSAAVTLTTRGIARIQAAGNDELADEIMAALHRDANSGSSRDRTWLSGVEYVARFAPDQQSEAWELLQKRGVRWLKRYVENQRSPKNAADLAVNIAVYLDREFPGVERDVMLEALERILDSLR